MEYFDCSNSPLSDHEERDHVYNDQNIVGGDDYEFLKNNSGNDTVSIYHKKV